MLIVHLSPDTLRREGVPEDRIPEMIALGQNDVYVGPGESFPARMEEWRRGIVRDLEALQKRAARG